jgi:hypothetical protein
VNYKESVCIILKPAHDVHYNVMLIALRAIGIPFGAYECLCCSAGARGGVPIRALIEAFIWHRRHGSLPLTANIPGHGEVPLSFSKWPDYGFDELFQLVVMYPWLAPGGTLSFIPSDARSMLLPADIEYAMWANPRSEAIYF